MSKHQHEVGQAVVIDGLLAHLEQEHNVVGLPVGPLVKVDEVAHRHRTLHPELRFEMGRTQRWAARMALRLVRDPLEYNDIPQSPPPT